MLRSVTEWRIFEFQSVLSAAYEFHLSERSNNPDITECFETISLLYRKRELSPTDDPEYLETIISLSKMLVFCFYHQHSLDDLEESIQLDREVLKLDYDPQHILIILLLTDTLGRSHSTVSTGSGIAAQQFCVTL